jgi:hypothetical protein
MKNPDLDILLVQLQDGRASVRLNAVKAFVETPNKLALKNLQRCMRDENAEIRYWSIFALEPFFDRKIVQEMMALFHDPSRLVRMAMLKVLGKTPSKALFEPIVDMLSDRESDVRSLASWSLSLYPEEYFPKLLDEFDSPLWLKKYHVFRAFILAGKKGLKAIRAECRKRAHSKEKLYWLTKLIAELRLKEQSDFLITKLNEERDEDLLQILLETLGNPHIHIFIKIPDMSGTKHPVFKSPAIA